MWRGDDEERVIQVHVVTIDIACSNTTGRCGVVMTRRELFRFTWSLSILPVVTRLVHVVTIDIACSNTTGRCGVVMTRRELFRFTWSLSILPVVTRLVDVAW
ncbi:hypothetical protein J6590_079503 [Homalodisca vitripennis]|nr:hypothetical protein J6590_079503 [Homalodisca vitripennis]